VPAKAHLRSIQATRQRSTLQRRVLSEAASPADLAAQLDRARLAPATLTARDIPQLQRTLGGQAVNRLLVKAGTLHQTGGLLMQRALTGDEKARLIDPERCSLGLVVNLYRRKDLTIGKFLDVYKAYRSDRPGLRHFSFAVEMNAPGVAPLEFHAHVSANYDESLEAGKVKHFTQVKFALERLNKSHLKLAAANREVGNLVDLTPLEMINSAVLDQYTKDIERRWFDNLYRGGTDRDRSELDDRHNITNPVLNLPQWSQSLVEGRIRDLFITLPGIPNHVKQVNQELTRLKPILQSERAEDADLRNFTLAEIESIKNALVEAMSGAEFADIDYQEFVFPTTVPTRFGISKARGKVTQVEY
jgi:hypothetical protein